MVANSDTEYFEGAVVSYDSGTGAMVLDVSNIVGAGTYSSWQVNLAGASGGNGTSGTTGTDGSSGTSGQD